MTPAWLSASISFRFKSPRQIPQSPKLMLALLLKFCSCLLKFSILFTGGLVLGISNSVVMPPAAAEIGRASCRERLGVCVVEISVKQKQNQIVDDNNKGIGII